jgi:hypothetical protein
MDLFVFTTPVDVRKPVFPSVVAVARSAAVLSTLCEVLMVSISTVLGVFWLDVFVCNDVLFTGFDCVDPGVVKAATWC